MISEMKNQSYKSRIQTRFGILEEIQRFVELFPLETVPTEKEHNIGIYRFQRYWGSKFKVQILHSVKIQLWHPGTIDS